MLDGRQLFEQIKKWPKEKFIVPIVVSLTVVLALWIANRDEHASNSNIDTELSLTIPKGFVVIPLELANGSALSALVTRNAVVDVFQPNDSRAAIENLRIIKLNAGEGPLFGALVPDGIAGSLQEIFSHPKLRAAIRTINGGPTSFHLSKASKPLLTEVPTGE